MAPNVVKVDAGNYNQRMKHVRLPPKLLVPSLVILLLLAGPILATKSHPVGASPDNRDGPVQPVAAQESSGGPFIVEGAATDTLRMTGPAQLTTLDPAQVRDLGQMFLVRQIFAGLMRFDDNLQAVPAVAKSVDISDDGLTYTFHLDQNARFYDGTQIVASDVVFSLSRAFDPTVAAGDITALSGPTFLADIAGSESMLSGETETLEGVVALDDKTVQITLSRPRSTFLMRLATSPGSIVDRRDLSLGEEWWQSPNASGPFAIQQFSPDVSLVLTANDHYVLGRASISLVDIRIGGNAFGGLNLYETNEIDIVGVDTLNIERIADPSSGFAADLTVSSLFSVEYIALSTDVEPFDDPLIREALLLGFPRNRVAEVSLNGRVGVAQGLIPDGMLGVDQWAVDAAPDIERARDLIAQSSYGSAENVPPITIYSSASRRAETFRDAIAENLGLRVNIVFVDWVSYLTGLQNREYPAYLLYWGADFPDPESILLTLFGSESADNFTGYQNEEFDSLLEQASLEPDPVTRVELYTAANQILMDDAVVVPLYFDVAYTLVKPWVSGVEMTPLGILYLDNVAIAEVEGS